MLICIPQVLDTDELNRVTALLDATDTPWLDGRVTAGHQGAPVKFNQQIDEHSQVATECQRIVAGALERNSLFISAALPNILYPPMFNRYTKGMGFGLHVDGGIRLHPHNGSKLRTDLAVTLFLSDPDSYDGGVLQMEDTYGMHSAKLPAGDMVVYPATSLHRVTPITRGMRVACFTWVQSLVREDSERALLFDMDNAIQRLNQASADETARRTLTGTYHNLLRKWSNI